MKSKFIITFIFFALAAFGAKAETAVRDTVPVTKRGITPPRNLQNYDPSQAAGKFGQVMGVKRYSGTAGDTMVGYLPFYVLSASEAYLGTDRLVTAGNISSYAPATDLGYTAATRVLTSSTGTDVTLPLSSSTAPGLLPTLGTSLQLARVNSAGTSLEYFTPSYLTAVTGTARFSGSGTSGSPLELAQQSAATGQGLGWNGAYWAPWTFFHTASSRFSGAGTAASPLEIAQQSATTGQVMTWNGTSWAPAAPSGGVTGSGTTNYLPKWSGSTALGNSVIYESGGNIGIGTTSLSVPFTVQTSSAGSIAKFHLNAGSFGYVSLSNTLRDWRYGVSNVGYFTVNDNTASTNPFQIEGAAPTNALYIRSNGSVGFNQSNPQEKVDVGGNIVLSGVLKLADGTAANPAQTFSADLNTGVFRPTADVYAISTGGSERVRVDASGNVGIGTATTTAAALTVKTGTNDLPLLDATKSFTNGNASYNVYRNFANKVTYTPTAASGTVLTGQANGVTIGGSTAYALSGLTQGAANSVDFGTHNGLISSAMGLQNVVISSAPATGTTVTGVSNEMYNSGGLWGTAYGNLSRIYGNVTNAYGYYADFGVYGGLNPVTSYGLYIGTSTATTAKWGVYQAEPAAKSYFGGNVGIANTSPSEKLDVTGNVRFSGALMPNNAAGTAGQVLTSAGAGAPPTWGSAGTIGGTAAANRVAYGDGSNSLTSSANFTYTSGVLEAARSAGASIRVAYSAGSVYTDIGTNSSGYGFLSPTGKRLGVNTTAPLSTLHLQNDGTNTQGGLFIDHNSGTMSTGNELQLDLALGGTAMARVAAVKESTGYGLKFYTGGAGAVNGAAAIAITGADDITIGTTASTASINFQGPLGTDDYQTETANSGTLAAKSWHYIDPTGAATRTLPSSMNDGTWLFVVNQDGTFDITISAPGGETLTGSATITAGKTGMFHKSGAVWYRITF